ncbi:TPA: hypothetical protein KO185_002184 [Clostridioides difficile]|uniref:hypothetical protein n=2 Tax=Clostridioides difficile TaxID=1496 RepID=UPI00038C738D|nr:hypothetical protein [Clostridioides difficile]EGT3956167.1 hypothetical protein [Clostridioides difficile]EGT4230025.1 hypothetical protein [Clostridioides difficile]EGT5079837.1 hypothetical protein [Clostridioides difficile]EGT5136775.1 hypothetical protein [Clostridioides difficile]EGT5282128.1 hypothetical protein [Clostridioides difficile]
MELKISDYKLLCNKGSGAFNEDIVGLSPYGAWVLDGATGLNNKNLVSTESDAKWYVSWWNSYLHENMEREDSLKVIIKEGIEEITKEYYKLTDDKEVEAIDIPSCSCSILKFYKDKIEYLLLGDCTLLVNNNESVKILKDETLCELDKKVFDFMKEAKDATNLTLKERKAEVMPIIIENRLKKNTVGGYWTLEFSKEAVDNCVSGFIDIEYKMKIMMASDGFSCGYDRYKIFDKNEMMKIAEIKGIDYIYRKVRELEKDDEMAIEFPRFKIYDDSSCVYLEIYKY